MSSFVKFLQSLGLLIARIGVGAILVAHGYVRWQRQGIDKQVVYLNQFSTPYPEVAAWGATIFELVGGVFLILGALTPIIGLALLVEQILVIAYTNWYKHWNLMHADGTFNGGYEYNVALGLLGLLFCVFGGGGAAIDRVFRRRKTDVDEDTSEDTVVRV